MTRVRCSDPEAVAAADSALLVGATTEFAQIPSEPCTAVEAGFESGFGIFALAECCSVAFCYSLAVGARCSEKVDCCFAASSVDPSGSDGGRCWTVFLM